MTSRSTIWRMTAIATASTVSLGGIPPVHAAPPPIPASTAEPPGRVGRLAHITGTVSFHTEDEDHWEPAVLNYPITTGNALWTEPGARADVEVSANRIAMDSQTELDMTTLDDHALVATEPQGGLYLGLRQIPNGDTYAVQTPRGVVQIAAAGRYEIVAGDTSHPTMITVVDGAAQVTGANIALQVGPRQTASISGTTTLQGSVGPMAQDAFLTAMLAQERPVPRETITVPPVVQQMTGCDGLDQYGAWQASPQYGTVWYPQVASDWVPYRDGQWSYVAPWGWTWVDTAPWGFAPFHYGRWAQIDHRWGWVPVDPSVGGYPAPVYAPALVGFVGIGMAGGLAAGAFAGGHGSVGWVPLGPNEPYYPPYRTSPNYVRSLNFGSVRNVSQIVTDNSIRAHTINNNNQTMVQQTFMNRGGATMVPAAAMVESRPIGAAAQAIPAAEFAQARPIGAAIVRPTAATAGVTPRVAQRFNFAPPARTGNAAPGPAINAALLRPAGPRGAAVAPALRPAGSGAVVGAPAAQPAEAPALGGTVVRPGAEPPIVPHAPGALPALRAPEIRPGGAVAGVREPAQPGAAPGLRGPEARPDGGAGGVAPALRGPEIRPQGGAAVVHAPGAPPAPRGPEVRPGGQPVVPREVRPEPARPPSAQIQAPHVAAVRPPEPPHFAPRPQAVPQIRPEAGPRPQPVVPHAPPPPRAAPEPHAAPHPPEGRKEEPPQR